MYYWNTTLRNIVVKMDGLAKGWNRVVRDVNKLFPDEKFTKSQIQDKQAQFKRSYKAIKSIVNRSGVSWNPISFMIVTNWTRSLK